MLRELELGHVIKQPSDNKHIDIVEKKHNIVRKYDEYVKNNEILKHFKGTSNQKLSIFFLFCSVLSI